MFLSYILNASTIQADNISLEKDFLLENKAFAGELDEIADGIDEFLTGEHLEVEEKNRTALKALYQAEFIEGEAVNHTIDVDLKLHLPKLEKKWKIFFSTHDSEDEARGFGRLERSKREKNYGTSLKFFSQFFDYDVEFRPRLEIRPRLGMTYYVKASNVLESDRLDFKHSLKLFADANEGTGISGEIGLNGLPRRPVSFHCINLVKYRDDLNLLTSFHDLHLGFRSLEKTFFSSGVSYVFDNSESYRLVEYSPYVLIRRVIYQDILNLSFSPFFVHRRQEGFSARFGLNFSAEIIF